MGLSGKAVRHRSGARALLMAERRLFLDCDGVLADFDAGARALFGEPFDRFQARHGSRETWRRIARADNFYGTLPEMPDARLLFDAVRHLDPTILTGLPLGSWAAPQKLAWAAEHYPGVAAGVIFFHDLFALDSLRQLAMFFPSGVEA